ncbi:MAG: hypothetical protein JJU45_17175 [Acidimicrobiia bacterium]|nr:hypothetical protein [Acidimicrobiia bacterium]
MSFDIILYALVTATALLTIVVVLCAAMVLREKADHGLARVAASDRAQRLGVVRSFTDRVTGAPTVAPAAAHTESTPTSPAATLPAGIRRVAGAGTALVIDPLPVEATAAARKLASPAARSTADVAVTPPVVADPPVEAPEALPVWEPAASELDPAVAADEPEGDPVVEPVEDLRQLAEEFERVVVHLDAERERLLGKPPERRRRRRRRATPGLSEELRRAIDEVATHESDARDLVVVEREPTSEIAVRVVLPETTGHPAARRRGA